MGNSVMKIGWDNRLYVVYDCESAADHWAWLYYDLLGMKQVCYNGYYNAWTYY